MSLAENVVGGTYIMRHDKRNILLSVACVQPKISEAKIIMINEAVKRFDPAKPMNELVIAIAAEVSAALSHNGFNVYRSNHRGVDVQSIMVDLPAIVSFSFNLWHDDDSVWMEFIVNPAQNLHANLAEFKYKSMDPCDPQFTPKLFVDRALNVAWELNELSFKLIKAYQNEDIQAT